MFVSVVPILRELRAIYEAEDAMSRFDAYRALMLEKDGEVLPLGVFSPMGRAQPAFLDRLVALDAEGIAATAAAEAARRLPMVEERFRVMLVVADVGNNGWTQRFVTDAEWRFEQRYDKTPNPAPEDGHWVSVQLWTDTEEVPQRVYAETQAAIYRCAHREKFGVPTTLGQMMCQEGRALAFAKERPALSASEIERAREILRPHLQCEAFPLCFTALYGDEIAQEVGYRPLGLAAMSAMEVGLADALAEGALEDSLV